MGSLRGRIAVVTGASRGIGKGIARALGEQGCVVYVTGRTSGSALLAADDLMDRSGTIQWVEDLAEEFDLYDEHGKRPPGYPRRR